MKNAVQSNLSGPNRECRRYLRLKKKIPVETGKVTYPLDDKGFAKGTTENISLGGVLIDTPKKLDTGALVQLKISLPGWYRYHPGFLKLLGNSKDTPFMATGEVLRCDKIKDQYVAAARFINVDPDDYIALQGYLENAQSVGAKSV